MSRSRRQTPTLTRDRGPRTKVEGLGLDGHVPDETVNTGPPWGEEDGETPSRLSPRLDLDLPYRSVPTTPLPFSIGKTSSSEIPTRTLPLLLPYTQVVHCLTRNGVEEGDDGLVTGVEVVVGGR